MTEYEYEYYSDYQNDRIRIRILFGLSKITEYEYEYYSDFQKLPNTNTERLAQLAGRPHKLIWPRIWSSKRVCWDSRDIRDKNAVNGVSSNIRSASHVSSYEAVFSEDYGLGIEDQGLRTQDRGLRTEDWGVKTEDWGLKTEDWRLRTQDRGPRT